VKDFSRLKCTSDFLGAETLKNGMALENIFKLIM
jgi:hypothetical protein